MHVLKQVYAKAARELIPLSVHFDLTYRCNQHWFFILAKFLIMNGPVFGEQTKSQPRDPGYTLLRQDLWLDVIPILT
jgi:hypothetical protein